MLKFLKDCTHAIPSVSLFLTPDSRYSECFSNAKCKRIHVIYNLRLVLRVVRGELVLHLLSTVDLTHHPFSTGEDNVVEFRDESEEVGIERDSVTDPAMKRLNIICSLEGVAVDAETFRADLPDPKINDVRFVEDEHLAPG